MLCPVAAIYERTMTTRKTDTECDVVDVVTDAKTFIPEKTLGKSSSESLSVSGEANDEATNRCLTTTEGTSLGETSSKPSTASDECLPIDKSSDASSSAEASSSAIKACRLLELNAGDCLRLSGAVFWPEDWRKQLCRCSKCMVSTSLYSDNCPFMPVYGRPRLCYGLLLNIIYTSELSTLLGESGTQGQLYVAIIFVFSLVPTSCSDLFYLKTYLFA